MFNRNTPLDNRPDYVIDQIVLRLQDSSLTPDDYTKYVDQLEKLYKIKSPKDSPVSFDALVGLLGNLAGIGMILQHERFHAVTSKALGFVAKTRG